jgi:hypothetical protein
MSLYLPRNAERAAGRTDLLNLWIEMSSVICPNKSRHPQRHWRSCLYRKSASALLYGSSVTSQAAAAETETCATQPRALGGPSWERTEQVRQRRGLARQCFVMSAIIGKIPKKGTPCQCPVLAVRRGG